MFGVVINGRPAMFCGSGPTGILEQSPGKWIVDINSPAEVCFAHFSPQILLQIADVSVFLVSSLPNGIDGNPTGLAVYFSTPPYQDWQFLTALSNSKPSVIVNAGWSLNPDVCGSPSIRLGVSIEPAVELLPKLETLELPDFRRDFARKIALNLFRFIESFSQGSSRDGNFLRCPQDVLDRWLVRFDEKYKRDPNFILKTN